MLGIDVTDCELFASEAGFYIKKEQLDTMVGFINDNNVFLTVNINMCSSTF